jgi:DNA-binding transcriptional LysR family regulator
MAEIELRLLRYFVTIAEERHFSRAAVRLGISPPTLTHQIQALETHLGVRLCHRRPRTRVELTDAGQRFLEQAQQVLRQVAEAESAARKAGRGEVGRIEVGYMMSVSCSGLIQKCVSGFRRAHPAIDINLHRLETMPQVTAIVDGRLDVGFMRPPKQYPLELDGFILFEQPMVVALPGDHALARRKRIRPADLSGEVFVTTSLEMDLGFREYTDAVTSIASFLPIVSKRAPDVFTVLTYVSAGFGIGIVSRSLGKLAIPNVAIRELDLAAPPLSPIACVFRRNEAAPAAAAFIRSMRRHQLKQRGADSASGPISRA